MAVEATGTTFEQIRTALSPVRGARLLLVEDNDLNRQVAEEFLVKCGLCVGHRLQRPGGAEQRSPDDSMRSFMDPHMPARGRIRSHPPIRALPGHETLPIIAMTAAAMTQDRQATRLADMNDHIAKPIDARELATVLKRLIRPTGGRAGENRPPPSPSRPPPSRPAGPRPDPRT